jgi:sigma-B regulation protein RsbU (phosphoserine phosphatase)
VEGATFRTAQVTLQPGELVVMYTDGLPEATNRLNEMLGQDRLAGWLTREKNISASDAVQIIRDGLKEFIKGKPLDDDITLVISKLDLDM